MRLLLVWITYLDHEPEMSWTEKFLREAPRDVRLNAVKVLPRLLEQLIAEGDKLASETAKGVGEAKQITASLKD